MSSSSYVIEECYAINNYIYTRNQYIACTNIGVIVGSTLGRIINSFVVNLNSANAYEKINDYYC